ncbi:MAG: tetratricopeptide repeat protein [Rhodobacteraceae bacterium]|nr:MAG: tetratricopeptide repeat protein [Paracoccaceae bacterium]
MTRRSLAALAAIGFLGACQTVSSTPDPFKATAMEEAGVADLLLESGDPGAAVRFFSERLAREPDDPAHRRSLARAHARAGALAEAASGYRALVASGHASDDDLIALGFVEVRLDRWAAARETAGALPPDLDTPRAHMLAALLADNARDWAAADAAYARAAQLSNNAPDVHNNWGVSLMARGAYAEAARRFEQALAADPGWFVVTNNLALSRALAGDFGPPRGGLSEAEKAIILHNQARVAESRGDAAMARRLYAAAVEVHPRHYPAAATRLAALDRMAAP